MKILALDMGGTHIGCAVVEDRKLLASSEISSAGAVQLEPMLPEIERELRRLAALAGVEVASCAGLAIGFPGIVDFRKRAVVSIQTGKYEDTVRLDLAAWSRRALGLPMAMENDARVALLGEHYAGAAEGCDDVVMLTLGTGIGGTAMMEGKVLRGVHAHAGSVGGHFVVDLEGRDCLCGGIGCAEAEASGSTLPQIAKGWPGFEQSSLNTGERVNFKMLFTEAAAGDRVALELRERCLHVWAANVVTNVLAYDPNLVVIGGGVMKSAAVIVPYIQEYVNKHTWASWGKPEVRAAALGNEAGLLGGIPLILEARERGIL